MICKECGQELSKDSIFCNKCGTKIETTVQEPVGKVQITQEKVVDNTKKIDGMKILLVGVVVLVVLIIVFALFGGSGRDYHGTNTPTYIEDDFGKNNEVITQPQTTEAITVAKPDVEIFVNRTEFYNSLNGTAELVDYQTSIMKNTNKVVLEVKIKVISKEENPWDMFTVPCTAYDANGTLLFSNNAWVSGWVTAETGDILRGTFDTMCKNGEVARIEIG